MAYFEPCQQHKTTFAKKIMVEVESFYIIGGKKNVREETVHYEQCALCGVVRLLPNPHGIPGEWVYNIAAMIAPLEQETAEQEKIRVVEYPDLTAYFADRGFASLFVMEVVR